MLGAIFLLIGLLALALFVKNQNTTQDMADSLEQEGQPNLSEGSAQFQAGGEGAALAGAVSGGGSKPQVRRDVEVSQAPYSEELKKQIITFQNLQIKSVMTESEVGEMQEMLKNGDLIRQVGEVLRSRKAMQDPQFEKLQSGAIDLIVQALKQGNEEAASEAAWDLIRDGQIEDSTIPLSERKILGGIKGEILYHATAIRPDIFQEVEMDLPGPASQQIWQNVQNQHQDNLKESQTEVQEYEAEQQQKAEENP